eukprot:scaffold224568_cov17-Tisochrysis_lutea.AAC.1
MGILTPGNGRWHCLAHTHSWVTNTSEQEMLGFQQRHTLTPLPMGMLMPGNRRGAELAALLKQLHTHRTHAHTDTHANICFCDLSHLPI